MNWKVMPLGRQSLHDKTKRSRHDGQLCIISRQLYTITLYPHPWRPVSGQQVVRNEGKCNCLSPESASRTNCKIHHVVDPPRELKQTQA